MDVLVSLLDGVPRPLAAGDELYIAYRSPSGDTYEEQLVNHVEMHGAESMAAARAVLGRLRQRKGEPSPDAHLMSQQ